MNLKLEDVISYLRTCTLSWFNHVLQSGWKTPLQHEQLHLLPPHLSCSHLYASFAAALRLPIFDDRNEFNCHGSEGHAFERNEKSKHPEQRLSSLRRVFQLIRILHGWNLLRAWWYMLAYQAGILCQPILLKAFVDTLVEVGPSGAKAGQRPWQVWVLPFLLFAVPSCSALLRVQSQYLMMKIQISIRSQLTCAVYRKTLLLSMAARQSSSAGRTVNLMTADVSKIADLVYPQLGFMMTGPFVIIAALIMLYFHIGWPTFAGAFVLVVCTPLTFSSVRIAGMHRAKMLQYADDRVKSVGQLLAGIRVVKMYVWEGSLAATVAKSREKELLCMWKLIPTKAVIQGLLYVLPTFASVCAMLAVGLVTDSPLDPGNVFAAIALFNLLRIPMINLSLGLIELSAAVVSLRRIALFMRSEELDEYVDREQLPAPAKVSSFPSSPGKYEQPAKAPTTYRHADDRLRNTAVINVLAASGNSRNSEDQLNTLSKESATLASKTTPGSGIAIVNGSFCWGDIEVDLHNSSSHTNSRTQKKRRGRLQSKGQGYGALAAGESEDEGSDGSGEGDDRCSKAERGGASPVCEGPRMSSAVVGTGDGKAEVITGGGFKKGPMKQKGKDGGYGFDSRKEIRFGTCVQFRLSDINLEVQRGERVFVVGRVGSGKSSLVSAALGEMELLDGSVHLVGRVAYVGQQAWVSNGTVINNITLGTPLQQDKWDKVVQACALATDLAIFPAGANTEIGEKGINLSGGQKQRVSLARSLYQDADVYILDDPLSAVDVHVGEHIFQNVILTGLKDKAVLMVTNQVQYLPHATRILVLREGRVALEGSYEECSADPTFAAMIEEFKAAVPESDDSVAKAKDAQLLIDAVMSDAAVPAKSTKQPTTNNLPSTPMKTGSSTLSQHPTLDLLSGDPLPAFDGQSGNGITVHVEVGDFAGSRVGGEERDLGTFNPDYADLLTPGVARHRDAVSVVAESMPRDWDPFSVDRKCPPGSTSKVSSTALALVPVQNRRSEAEEQLENVALDDDEEDRRALLEGKPGDSMGSGTSTSYSKGDERLDLVQEQTTKGRITVIEDRELGQVKYKVYLEYFSAFSWWFVLIMVLLQLVEQSSRIGTGSTLARWSNYVSTYRADNPGSVPHTEMVQLSEPYAIAYFLFFVGATLGAIGRVINSHGRAYFASRTIHDNMMKGLLHAPMSFFESTPTGRIMNRVARDVDDMDYNVGMYIMLLSNALSRMLAAMVFLCVLRPALMGVLIPLAGVYFVLQKYFRRTSIELQRLESVSRSPVVANFSETLSGLETIRAYQMTETFFLRHEDMTQINAVAYFNGRVADEWLALRLDLLASTVIMATALLSVIFLGSLDPAFVGLSLSEGMDLMSFLGLAVRSGSQLESRFNAVERILAYTHLKPEGVVHTPAEKMPHKAWPRTGTLKVSDLWVRYRPHLDPVIRGITFSVCDGEKLGIVGRTGSGKSSLILALFRILEPYRGHVVLDGVDLRSLGLSEARRALSVIPQDPVLFAGNLRFNLDPAGECMDEELWKVLDLVALRSMATNIGGLDGNIAEGGDNLSVGQRQLLCVARALLRKPKVLVADEATASVDVETDALIQQTIRENFKSSTVLTIAHRLNTILDSDKILLLDSGIIAEFDGVSQLLATPSSRFRKMVQDAGMLD